jgi:hypothetical protein
MSAFTEERSSYEVRAALSKLTAMIDKHIGYRESE